MSSFNPTTKTQEALQTAVQLASAKGNPDVRPAHLLVGVLDQPDGIAAPVLQAAGADPKAVLDAARKLERLSDPHRIRKPFLTPPVS